MRYRNATLLASLFVLALAASPASRAGEVRFDGVLPNGAPYVRNVESMQEGRYRNMVRQHTDYSCGAAALASSDRVPHESGCGFPCEYDPRSPRRSNASDHWPPDQHWDALRHSS